MGRCTKTILERNRILKRINGAEGFCLYDLEKFRDESEKDVILEGSTKLPSDVDGELFFDIVDWWLKCLEEMVDMLAGAQWNVHLDDMELKWSEKEHSFCVDDTVEN